MPDASALIRVPLLTMLNRTCSNHDFWSVLTMLELMLLYNLSMGSLFL